jgi:hypothetical protein
MGHNRRLVFSAVGLVKARVRGEIPVMNQVRDELECALIEAEWFPSAPFRWIGLMFRYGLKTDSVPHFETIDPDDGELPIAIEIDTHVLLELSKDKPGLARFIKNTAIECLLAVAAKYGLPNARLVSEKGRASAT